MTERPIVDKRHSGVCAALCDALRHNLRLVDWSGILVGAIAGFGLSLILWWFQYRVLVPRITFASGISKIVDDDPPNYRIKFTNTGRRGIIDVEVDVRVYIGKGAIQYEGGRRLTGTSYSMRILTSSSTQNGIMRVKPGASRVLRLDLRRCTWNDVNPRLLEVAGVADLPDDESIDLERLLEATETAYLQVRLLAYDEVSGTRKFFQSGKQWAPDIHVGVFDGLIVRERRSET
jgi:hypothetical protein